MQVRHGRLLFLFFPALLFLLVYILVEWEDDIVDAEGNLPSGIMVPPPKYCLVKGLLTFHNGYKLRQLSGMSRTWLASKQYASISNENQLEFVVKPKPNFHICLRPLHLHFDEADPSKLNVKYSKDEVNAHRKELTFADVLTRQQRRERRLPGDDDAVKMRWLKFLHQKRLDLWLGTAQIMAGGTCDAPTDGQHMPSRKYFGTNCPSNSSFRTGFILLDTPNSVHEQCDFYFTATTNFILQATVQNMDMTLLPQQQCGYIDSDTGSEWHWQPANDNQNHQKVAAKNRMPRNLFGCSTIEKKIVCMSGSCGWKRPAIISLKLPSRLGNQLTLLSAASVFSIKLNLTLYADQDEPLTKTYRCAYLVPFWGAHLSDNMKDSGHVIPEWRYGAGFQHCGVEIDTHLLNVMDAKPDQFFWIRGYMECYQILWPWFYLLDKQMLPESDFLNISPEDNMLRLRAKHPGIPVISVHVRSGDKNFNWYFNINGAFLLAAVNAIHEQTLANEMVLAVVTENVEYAQQVICDYYRLLHQKYLVRFHGDVDNNMSSRLRVHFYIHNEDFPHATPSEDMQFASLADHFIFSTGTFSWWISFRTPGVRIAFVQSSFLVYPENKFFPFVDLLDTDVQEESRFREEVSIS